MTRPTSAQGRALEALAQFGRTGATTDEVMLAMRDDRPTVYGALTKLLEKKQVQRKRSGATINGSRALAIWRLPPANSASG